MKIITASQMRTLDQVAIKQHGIAANTLMDKAGQQLAKVAANYFNLTDVIGVLAGPGNNGGDALVAAGYLKSQGFQVREFPIDAAALQAKVVSPQMQKKLSECSGFIDGLFGVGLNRKLGSFAIELINLINSSNKLVLSADIPSGINADSGEMQGAAIKANHTITFALPKPGLFLRAGLDCSGKITVADIGIPQVEIAKIPSKLEFINSENFAPDFPARNKDTHKGSCGHTILFAGHASMLGAGYMASLAALRVGSGLVTYALPASSFKKFDARFPEIMPESVPDNNKGEFNLQGKSTVETLLQKKTVAAIGPGIGTSKETIAFIEWLLTNINLPMVLDADALNCLQNKTALLSRRSAPTIITPHPGEMARLLNIDIATLKQNRDILAAEFAQTHHVYLILKGAHSLLATPEGKIYINSTGNPGMASAGMGDALTGIVAGFLAQGISPCAAACAAIYVHGLAGDIAAEKSAHLITSDVIDLLPIAMQRSGI